MSAPSGTRSDRSLLMLARAGAVATLMVVLGLYGTAGLLVQSGQAEDLHGLAAILVHVTTGVMAAALSARALMLKTGWGSAVAAVALFGFTFLQAAVGETATLAVHIVGALVLAVVSTWLVAATLTKANRKAAMQ